MSFLIQSSMRLFLIKKVPLIMNVRLMRWQKNFMSLKILRPCVRKECH